MTAIGLFSCGPVQFSTQAVPSGDKLNPSGNPTPTPTQTQTSLTRDVTNTTTVNPPNNKLDILLVVDNSNSMLADNQKLAQRLSGFVGDLQNSAIDWQMCVTVTSTLTVNGSDVWGASVYWSNYTPASGTPNWILKSGTANLYTIFTNTIDAIGAGWANTDDERGIKAAWWSLYHGDYHYNGNSGCYRNGAALAVVVISDEDERSVGGNAADQYYVNEFKLLEDQDLPENLVQQVQDVFGMNKRFTVNSIIVKPDDQTCMSQQDSGGAKSHYGRIYSQLSQLTGGAVTSICENDYSNNLKYFKDVIQTSLASFPLECAPVNGQLSFMINGSASSQYQATINGLSVNFTPALPSGTQLTLSYKCPVN
jgi:hypothetical protein